ncbi:MAG TPA: thiamine pyrophosphate-dependent dehydrogenase E1 component subunit alpha [Caulobacteraceae bacterium]
MNAIERLRTMMLIRAFERTLAARPDHGFQLLSAGEEAVAVGLCSALQPGDQLLTGGRSIGPALARGVDPKTVMAELLGKSAGVNRGKAGRGHLADPEHGFFGAHAVVGGNLSIAAGVALAQQLSGQPNIVCVLFGDGAAGSGALHETLNIAALWKLPLLFVCNNNQLSVSTPRRAALAPRRLADLAAPFGVPAQTVDGMDVVAVAEAIASAARGVRSGAGPAFVECESERFGPHSTTARETRDPETLERIRARCPILRLTGDLELAGAVSPASLATLEAEVEAMVAEAVAFAEAAPYPSPSEALADVG